MSKSRWAGAPREQLEALASATYEAHRANLTWAQRDAIDALRASCPPLRREAEVAAEVLELVRGWVATTNESSCTLSPKNAANLRALAKEQTRD